MAPLPPKKPLALAAQRSWRFIAFVLFTFWWGGLTFYAGIVVHEGGRIFGTASQGFVTQRVTWWLNLLLLVALIAIAAEFRSAWPRLLKNACLVLLFSLIGLSALHLWMDRFLDASTRAIDDRSTFYMWHRIYLWGTAVQWLAGLVALWGIVFADCREGGTGRCGGSPANP